MSQSAQIKLKQALLILLDENEFDQLSVSKICKEADVNRSTFYAYYDNQFQLLEDTQSYIIEIFNEQFPSFQKQFQAPKEYDSLVDSYYLVPYLYFIKEHQKLYKIYLKNPINFNHAGRDESHIVKQFIKRYRDKGIIDEKKIRYMSAFYTIGIRQISHDWVMDGCQDNIDYLVDIIHEIIF